MSSITHTNSFKRMEENNGANEANEFLARWAYELNLDISDAISIYNPNTHLKFSSKPKVESFPVDGFTTTDTLATWNIFYNIRYRYPVLFYAEHKIVSLVGASLKVLESKLDADVFTNKASIVAIEREFRSIGILSKKILVAYTKNPVDKSVTISDDRELIYQRGEPLQGIPLRPVAACYRCYHVTFDGAKKVRTHFLDRHGEYDASKVERVVTQTLYPLGGFCGKGSKYFQLEAPESAVKYLMKPFRRPRVPAIDSDDIIETFPFFAEDTESNFYSIDDVNDGEKLFKNLSMVFKNSLMRFYHATKFHGALISTIPGFDKLFFTSKERSCYAYGRTMAKLLLTEMIRYKSKDREFLKEGVSFKSSFQDAVYSRAIKVSLDNLYESLIDVELGMYNLINCHSVWPSEGTNTNNKNRNNK